MTVPRGRPRPKWTCPKCGRTLTVRNQEHTCGLYDVELHFTHKNSFCRTAFDWMLSVFDAIGGCDVLPMKTTIGFAKGVNVAFLTTKRIGAEISIVLSRPLASSRVTRRVPYSRTKTIYRVRITSDSDLDDELADWLREAYLSS